MFKFICLAGAVAVMLPLFAFAADEIAEDIVIPVDVRFDKTGDGIVDVSDWSQMSIDEQKSYARASLKALGEDPDVLLLQGKSRAEKYLEGLRSVYE
ncbi:MAG: hypothetical protein Q9M14_07525 [Mariprofundaceae bacterium]|nr:hypothetical protein [Mariprofundaceae bacterium]